MAGFTPEQEILLADWFRRTRESQRVHYECANHFNKLHLWMGIPTIVLSAAVGTAVFASLETSAWGMVRIIIGLVSIAAAVCASLQTFLGYSERADHHRSTASGYGSLRRSFEHLKTFPPTDLSALEQAFSKLKEEMDHLAASSPAVPTWLKARIDAELKSRDHKRVFHLPADGIGGDNLR